MSDGPAWTEQERQNAKSAVRRLVIPLLVEIEGTPVSATRIEDEVMKAMRDPAGWVRNMAEKIRHTDP
jgi:hypothetical protein